jgi:hypothetical protein
MNDTDILPEIFAANELIRLALARVEESLKLIMIHIAEIQRDIASRPPTHRDQDAIPPYNAWVGTP